MKVRFSVVVFGSHEARVALSGSIPSLGSWKTPIAMSPIEIPADEFHPSMWTVVVDIPDTVFRFKSEFQYKFIRWSSTPLSASPQPVHAQNELSFPDPVHISEENKLPVDAVWEGYGGSENRSFTFHGESSTKIHVFDPILNITPDGIYSPPVSLFREPLTAESEVSHTTRYFRRLKERGEMHFNRVLDRVFVGSCPRSKQHIGDLKTKTKISDFINCQTAEDIVENFPDPLGTPARADRTIDKVYEIFDSFNIRYIWIPITDMCSASRARTIAQAAFLLAGLLQRPDCTGVYVHCNAGVGRSVACVVGYIHCCLNVPLRLTNLIVSARRPVAFFDEPALIQGANDFKAKFDSATKLLNLPKLTGEENHEQEKKGFDSATKLLNPPKLTGEESHEQEKKIHEQEKKIHEQEKKIH